MMEIGRLVICPKGGGEIIGLLLGYAVVRLESGEEWVGLQKEVKCKRLPAKHNIVVGNIGLVYEGANENSAKQVYDQYVALSLSGLGRAGNENVIWFVNDQIRMEWCADGGMNEPILPDRIESGSGAPATLPDAPDPFEPM